MPFGISGCQTPGEQVLAMHRANRRLIVRLAPAFHAVEIDVMAPDLAAEVACQHHHIVGRAIAPGIEDRETLVAFGEVHPALLIRAGGTAPRAVRLHPYRP